jgi:hypothetical protein
MNLPFDDIQSFQDIIRASGRDIADYSIELTPLGQVHVTGPNGTAFYPRACWMPAFSRHLERAFFDLPKRVPQGLSSGTQTQQRAT